jgi:RHS repeat-associated protein
VVKHTYDADGNRVRTEVTPATGPPVVTDYLVDPSGALSQVVAETGTAGAWSQYFVRGDDLLAVLRPTATRFFHADGLGSIRALTDETGAVTDTYTFSAFGELLSHTGPDLNAYLFAGEPLDPNSGFYYLRARWMDPGVGRFGGVDSWPGNLFEPATLHRYSYVGNDPAAKIDPSGRSEFSLSGLAISAAIGGIISGISGLNAQSTLASFGKDFLIGALEGALLYGASVAIFKVIARLGSLALRSYSGAQAVRIGQAIERVMTRVVNAGEAYPGTSLPKFFTFRSTLGDVFLNPNATKHMFEVLRSTGSAGSTEAATALLLQDLDAAITRAAIEGFRYGTPIRVGAWELIFVIENKVGQELVPLVLKHAIFFY